MRDVASHRRIGLDASVLIYLLETQGPLADAAAAIVDSIGSGAQEGVLSAIGLVEILTGPASVGDATGFELTADGIRDLGIRVVPLGAAAAEDVAWLRGSLGLPLADAVHLVSARNAGATVFVTNDRRIRPIPRLDVVYLEDLVA